MSWSGEQTREEFPRTKREARTMVTERFNIFLKLPQGRRDWPNAAELKSGNATEISRLSDS